jgi:hypothetical protein
MTILFSACDNAVLHEPVPEGSVHAVYSDDLPDGAPPYARFDDDWNRVPDSHKYRVKPGRESLFGPVRLGDIFQANGFAN